MRRDNDDEAYCYHTGDPKEHGLHGGEESSNVHLSSILLTHTSR